MCGIAGVIDRSERPRVQEPLLREMARRLAHRGPDGEGVWIGAVPGGGVAGFAHRRLSIIDVAGGGQPMVADPAATGGAAVAITYNGEVYNFLDLRRALQDGYRFRTRSDTEVLLAAYLRWGTAMVERLRGMFAFAIFDGRDGTLFAARDRMGKKPFSYWTDGDRRIAFASEPRAILAVPGFERRVDPRALDAYLALSYVPSPLSIFAGVRKLEPGEALTWREGALRTWRHAEPRPSGDVPASAAQAARDLDRRLAEAVRVRLVSDVPLGAFLSGGIDSSTVVALMAREGGAPVKTFAIGFDDRAYDEAAHARAVARHLGTEHHEEVVRPQAIGTLPRLAWHYGEPYGDSSAIPTLHLAELTARHVKVALSGDGGDELFHGYPRHVAAWAAGRLDRLPRAARRVLSAGRHLIPSSVSLHSRRRAARKFLEELDRPAARRFRDWITLYREGDRAGLVSPDWRADPAWVEDFLDRRQPLGPDAPVEARAAGCDLMAYLPEDLMTKVDIAAMAHGLEVRCPFLDAPLVDWVLGLPASWKLAGGRTKILLRRMAAPLLPRATLRRRKQGFGVPVAEWWCGPLRDWVRGILSPESLGRRGFFRNDDVQRLLREHQEGRAQHGARIWLLVFFEVWARTYLDADGGSPVDLGPPALNSV